MRRVLRSSVMVSTAIAAALIAGCGSDDGRVDRYASAGWPAMHADARNSDTSPGHRITRCRVRMVTPSRRSGCRVRLGGRERPELRHRPHRERLQSLLVPDGYGSQEVVRSTQRRSSRLDAHRRHCHQCLRRRERRDDVLHRDWSIALAHARCGHSSLVTVHRRRKPVVHHPNWVRSTCSTRRPAQRFFRRST